MSNKISKKQKNDVLIRAMLPTKLKADFIEAVRNQGHTSSSMLRGFMRSYVEMSKKMEGKQFGLRIGAQEVVK